MLNIEFGSVRSKSFGFKNSSFNEAKMISKRRSESFRNQISLYNKINSDGMPINKQEFYFERKNIRNCTVSFVIENGTKDLEIQKKAVEKSLKDISYKGIKLPENIKVYILRDLDYSYSFNGSMSGEEYPHIFLGQNISRSVKMDKNETKSFNNENALNLKVLSYRIRGGVPYADEGRPRIVADQIVSDHQYYLLGGFRKFFYEGASLLRSSAAITHELGHIMHEKTSPQKFYELGDTFSKRNVNTRISQDEYINISNSMYEESQHVSYYSAISKMPTEFVAEVFTGLVYGLKYPKSTLDMYKEFGGPAFNKRFRP